MTTKNISEDLKIRDAAQGGIRIYSESFTRVTGAEVGMLLTEDEASKLMFALAAKYGYEIRER